MRMPGRRCDASPVTHAALAALAAIEKYYDSAPRPLAQTHAVGPFTLFVRTDPAGWPFYARPRLGLDTAVTPDDVAAVIERQRELDLPPSIEWVEENTPSLAPAAEAAGLSVTRCPMLSLVDRARADRLVRELDDAAMPRRVRLLSADDPDLDRVLGAIHAGFSGSDEITPSRTEWQSGLIRHGLLVVVGAYDERGDAVGGGSHGPRGDATELTGIAVIPRARRLGHGGEIAALLASDALRQGLRTVLLSAQDDAVARVYERVGFGRVGTACTGEPG